jgi:filamentous hemagglutinin family protein
VHKKTVVATILLAFIPFSLGQGHAAVSTSITPTIGTGNLGTNISQAENVYSITGGTRPGGGPNLFHSFGNFSVGSGDIANFQNTLVNGSFPVTSNILARVTGGNVSNIFGTIQTTNFGNANLFLINPVGFLFGSNATVNVGGMMAFTTADYMRLTDGGRFNANPNATPSDVLTAAPVAAFGFLGSSPAAINFEGGQLTVASEAGLSLVGGDTNLLADGFGTPSGITAHGRPILLTSVAGPGEVTADTGIPASGLALGTVTLAPGTILDTTGDSSVGDGSGGAISIRGGQLLSSGATMLTSPAFGTTGQGGAVTITASDIASLTDGSTITTSSTSPNGDAGAVSINGSQVILQDSVIFTEYIGDGTTSGSAGAVTFTGTESVVLIRTGIATDFSNTDGNGGAVSMTAPNITLEDSFILTGNTFQPQLPFITIGGSAGAVTLTGESSVTLTRSGIDTSTVATTGDSGGISITAPTVTIADVGPTFLTLDAGTRLSDNPTVGNAGDIFIGGTNITISNFATIQSHTESAGSFSEGGNIQIVGEESILIDSGRLRTITTSQAKAGDIQLAANHVTITGQSTVTSDTIGPGGGGTIEITGTESIELKSGSLISTNTDPVLEGNEGPAGRIDLATQQLTISDGTIVRSQGVGSGSGGTVTVQGISGPAQSILIDGFGSGIFTDTQGSGAGGNISVNANTVTLQNGGTLSAATSSTGNAGDIQIAADTLALDGSSRILANTGFGSEGRGGNIDVQVRSAFLTGVSSISTGTLGLGDAGNIKVQATESMTVTNGSAISTDAFDFFGTGSGNAGLIHLTAPTIELQGGIISSLSQGPGNAGNINLEAISFTAGNGSFISSESLGPGRGGDISIQGLTGDGSRAGSVTMLGGTSVTSTTSGEGRAGDIRVTTERIAIVDSSVMGARTAATGDAGSITIDASQSVQISSLGGLQTSSDFGPGNAGQITITTPTLTVEQGGAISTSSGATGNAGSITVNVKSLNLLSGGQLTSSSSVPFPDAPPPSGSAGTVTVNNVSTPAESVLVDGLGSGIYTDTQGSGAGGNIVVYSSSVTIQNGGALSAATSGSESSATGGTITVNAGQVNLNSGGLLTASTTGAGAGGSININADSTFAMNGSTVSSSATEATGGDINISAGQSVTLENGSVITASSNGGGNAGNIQINAGQQYSSTNSSVTTKAEQASGGNITVLATGLVHLTNSELNASVEGSSTTVGGNILIDPVYVILENSQILAQATQGQGGNINIFYTGALLADPSTLISASSQFGQQGTVTIQSPISPASGKINPLGQKPLVPTSLLNQRCAAVAGGNISSFTIAGRDSMPSEPSSWLSTPLLSLSDPPSDGEVREARLSMSQSKAEKTSILSVRKIAPPGFLTQSFAVEARGCRS